MEQPSLQQENARFHINTKKTAGVRRFGITLLDHPTYRLDLVSSGIHLFCKLKDRLRGRHYVSDDGVRVAVKLWFRSQSGQCCRNGLYEITWSMEKSLGPQSDYVEKKKYIRTINKFRESYLFWFY